MYEIISVPQFYFERISVAYTFNFRRQKTVNSELKLPECVLNSINEIPVSHNNKIIILI